MGGGIRGNRIRYTGNPSYGTTKNLSDYMGSGSPTAKRVFISFHVEDEPQVDLLRHQAKDDKFDLEFVDYSVKEPFDEKWKTQCTERIKQSSLLLVMIGEDTHEREAVLWEINKAYELGVPVIGVRIYKDENHKVPEPLLSNRAKIVNWSMEEIQNTIDEAKK